MKVKVNKIKRRMKKRREHRTREIKSWQPQDNFNLLEDEERYGFEKLPTTNYFPPSDDPEQPTLKQSSFLGKLFIAASLFLFVTVIYRTELAQFTTVKSFITNSFTETFQFAAVADWYEEQFGKPLALLPVKLDQGEDKSHYAENSDKYAVPTSGTVIKTFEKNGQGVLVETGVAAEVEVINEGIVRFAGVDDTHGKTVIIQHANKTETSYGNLDEINVNLFDFVKKGTVIGKVSENEDGTKGSFYFSIKQGGDFINPLQVIKFE